MATAAALLPPPASNDLPESKVERSTKKTKRKASQMDFAASLPSKPNATQFSPPAAASVRPSSTFQFDYVALPLRPSEALRICMTASRQTQISYMMIVGLARQIASC